LTDKLVSIVRSGDVFPGRDPIYDDLIATQDYLGNLKPVDLGPGFPSSLNTDTAGVQTIGQTAGQLRPEVEVILLKAQLNRRERENTSLKERVQAKVEATGRAEVFQTLSNIPSTWLIQEIRTLLAWKEMKH
jgi:hypothetical protein